MPRRSRWVGARAMFVGVAVCAALAVTVAGCSSPATEGGAVSTHPANSPYADAVAVLGNSISTAHNSDPAQPNTDVPANSWATGTNPDIKSIYSRVVALNPRAAGHVANLAVDSADVSGVLDQARALLRQKRPRELVLVQSISAELRCDGSDGQNIEPFARKVGAVLDVLSKGMPDADVVLVSQFGTAQNFAEVFLKVRPTILTGNGPCNAVDPTTGQLVPSKIAAAQALVEAYETRTAAVCAAHKNCRTDGFAARKMVLAPDDFAAYDIHFSIAGQRAFAATLWPAIYPNAPPTP